MKLADIDRGSRVVGNVDGEVIVSRGNSRKKRGTDPRPSAEAWCRDPRPSAEAWCRGADPRPSAEAWCRGPRPSAGAWCRGAVAAKVACNQVHPILLGVAQERRRQGRIARNGRVVPTGGMYPEGGESDRYRWGGLESNEANFGLETDGRKRANKFAKIWRTLVGLGYVRVGSKF